MSVLDVRTQNFRFADRDLTVFAVLDGIEDTWRIDVREGTKRVILEVIYVSPEIIYDAATTNLHPDFLSYWMDEVQGAVIDGRYKLFRVLGKQTP